ncbi:uncharacterized protein LOC144750086 [Ciona intestinalis]
MSKDKTDKMPLLEKSKTTESGNSEATSTSTAESPAPGSYGTTSIQSSPNTSASLMLAPGRTYSPASSVVASPSRRPSYAPPTILTPHHSIAGSVMPGTEEKKKKKPPPPFLQKEVKIKNPKEINHSMLLQILHKKFLSDYEKWQKKTRTFKMANLIVTIIIISVQVTQVVLFQLNDKTLSSTTKKAVATILPSITSAILALQLKLGWSEKGTRCKKGLCVFIHKCAIT